MINYSGIVKNYAPVRIPIGIILKPILPMG